MRRILLFAWTGLLVACGAHHDNDTSPTPDGSAQPDAQVIDAFAGPYSDFPAQPIIDGTAPINSPTLFGSAGTGSAGGPCLFEPEIGTIYPQNWLRPQFSWVPTGTENLFEIRLTAANQVNPLVIYTQASTFTMPASIWTGLSIDTVEQPITLTIRGATYDATSMALTEGPDVGSTGDIEVANAQAPGAIVYWTSSQGTLLNGFHIGDETVQQIVAPAQNGSATACVGCHSATPDGVFVAFSATDNAGDGDPAELSLLTSNGSASPATFISASAQTLMARIGQEEPTFSSQHWQAGDYTAVNMFPINNAFEIMWTDLQATSTAEGSGWGVVARTNDSNPAAYAQFAHTTDQLLYVSSSVVTSGVTVTHGDIMTLPFNDRAGGSATPVSGANTSTYNEYYPVFSPDDQFIAFNRVTDGESSYANSDAEVFVIPSAGGTPVRLAANDPPACTGLASPGIENSWPRWAPDSSSVNGKTYYWLTFSSTRVGGIPQLFVTPVVLENGTLTTYPALYLWNQPATEHNHTPAWGNFEVPIE